MKQLGLWTTALLSLGGIAAAGCPGHVGSVPGLKLTRSEPYVAYVYRQTDQGLSEVQAPGTVAAGDEVLKLYPHPLVDGQQISATAKLAFVYEADPSELEMLDRIGVWRSAASFLLNGREIRQGQIERRLIGTEVVKIGDCETEVWQVEARMDLGTDDGSMTVLSYAPSLGVVVRSETWSADGAEQQLFVYDQIEALAD